MPLFRYEATDVTGNTVRGAMQVESEQAVGPRLEAMGYRLVQVEPAVRTLRQATPTRAATAGRAVQLPGAPTPPPGASSGAALAVPERDVARLFHQLQLAMRAGMTPSAAFGHVEAQVPHPALRTALAGITAGVREGRPISDLMAEYPRIFGAGDIGLIRAGEQAGRLPEALELIGRRREEDENARGRLRLWVWLLHSNVIAVLGFIPVAFFLKDVFPSFNVVTGLASAMRVLFFVSVPLGLGYALLVQRAQSARLDPARRRGWDRLLLRIGSLRKVHQARAKAVFTRSLAWQFNAGVAPGAAWETAAAAVPNVVLAEQFQQAAPAVASGRPSVGLQLCGLMDPTDVGLVQTGETTGEIPQALGFLADRCEAEAQQALQDAVVQGRVRMIVWFFLIGGLGMCVFFWGYFSGVMKLADGFE
jgi:type IV pilus assembly protein PilC